MSFTRSGLTWNEHLSDDTQRVFNAPSEVFSQGEFVVSGISAVKSPKPQTRLTSHQGHVKLGETRNLLFPPFLSLTFLCDLRIVSLE